uniref:Uncharacterized protein n=2 Tax=Clastoptera arizonana TaxID=38151 RepID=A0A1B6D0A1_9HEMI
MTFIFRRGLINLSFKFQENTLVSCFHKRNRMGPPDNLPHRDLNQPDLPKKSAAFRRKVHYPEKYTVEPLRVTNLGGRDPETGRKVVNRVGGGLKYKYHWVWWKREGPKEGPPLVERVIQIMDDFARTAKIALVAGDKQMKYYLATANMKAGDLIRTSEYIPRNAVAAKEGDAFPLGALPMGTVVCCVEKNPDGGGYYAHAAGTFCTLMRRLGDKVIIQLPSKIEVALPKENMAVVGRISNVEHHKIPIGSAQRSRELGIRPKSGWWQRKTGRFGRKLRPPPPLKILDFTKKEKVEPVVLTLNVIKKPKLFV